MNDERQFERFKILKATFYRKENSEKIYECTIIDISRGGMMLVPEINLAINEEIIILYHIRDQIFKDKIKIKWEKDGKNGGEFVEVRPERDKMIESYLKL